MKKSTILILALSVITNLSIAQSSETDKSFQAEVKKLSFLVGEWKGSGWMMGQDRVKRTFEQTENIQFKLDSTAILIEGLGKSDGEIVHNALAIITSSGAENQFDFQSFLPSGQKGTFKSEIKEDVYYWYPAESVRYIIKINEKGQWFEIGEFNQGDTWYTFLEMTLDRK
ncbi:hypothetical protein [Algoriphagus winogradskyi]|uniref:DUF1579 domain-containing protein n=1 Tax=Algoriphagus winogradskyi TaxID=237017 RepID=A0ABY1NR62_9BACT|nr:hypothetical protein [Algoriphagus winogradskyi]SMP15894.1 hypothetical protein SAMN06265367_102522 [Algoriphagus winogradskyi]